MHSLQSYSIQSLTQTTRTGLLSLHDVDYAGKSIKYLANPSLPNVALPLHRYTEEQSLGTSLYSSSMLLPFTTYRVFFKSDYDKHLIYAHNGFTRCGGLVVLDTDVSSNPDFDYMVDIEVIDIARLLYTSDDSFLKQYLSIEALQFDIFGYDIDGLRQMQLIASPTVMYNELSVITSIDKRALNIDCKTTDNIDAITYLSRQLGISDLSVYVKCDVTVIGYNANGEQVQIFQPKLQDTQSNLVTYLPDALPTVEAMLIRTTMIFEIETLGTSIMLADEIVLTDNDVANLRLVTLDALISGSMTSFVIVSEDGLPIENAKVQVAGFEGYTSTSGVFNQRLELGEYTVTISHADFIAKTMLTDIHDDNRYIIVTMTPAIVNVHVKVENAQGASVAASVIYNTIAFDYASGYITIPVQYGYVDLLVQATGYRPTTNRIFAKRNQTYTLKAEQSLHLLTVLAKRTRIINTEEVTVVLSNQLLTIYNASNQVMFSGKTGLDGRLSYGLPNGTYTIVLHETVNFERTEISATIVNDELYVELDVVNIKTRTITITAVTDDALLQGVRILTDYTDTITNVNGVATADVTVDNLDIIVSKAGYQAKTIEADLITNAMQVALIRNRYNLQILVTSDGTPLQEALVSAVSELKTFAPRLTDVSGTAAILNAASSMIDVTVSKESYETEQQSILLLDNETLTFDISKIKAIYELHIVNELGVSVPYTDVVVSDSNGDIQTYTTDGSGMLRCVIAYGETMLHFQANAYATRHLYRLVTEDASETIVLLGKSESLDIFVKDSMGTPLEGLDLRIYNFDRSEYIDYQSDMFGHLLYTNEAGTYYLVASHNGIDVDIEFSLPQTTLIIRFYNGFDYEFIDPEQIPFS